MQDKKRRTNGDAAEQPDRMAPEDAGNGALHAESDAPDETDELQVLRERLRQYEQAEEEQKLLNDVRHGEAYRRWRDEVHRVADYANHRGRAVSLTAAFHAVLLEHLDEMIQEAAERAGREALEELRANECATPSALGGETVDAATDYGQMSDEEFNRVLRMALNGELKHG